MVSLKNKFQEMQIISKLLNYMSKQSSEMYKGIQKYPVKNKMKLIISGLQ